MKKKNPDNRSVSGTEITPSSGTMTIENAKAIIRREGWITAEEYIKLQLDPKKPSERVKQMDPKEFSKRVKQTIINDIDLGRPKILIIFPEGDGIVYLLRGQDIPAYKDKHQLIDKIKGDSLVIYHK